MKASQPSFFQLSISNFLRRPWHRNKDGTLWYGQFKTGTKRHPLTTKQGNKTFYKGTRSNGYGKLNSAGHFIMDWQKVRTYVVPADLKTTNLKCLVLPNTPQIRQVYKGYKEGALDPELAWQNIKDFIEFGVNYSDNHVDLEKNDYLIEVVNPNLEESGLIESPIIKRD
ncbi:hypothetical protein METBISCDRAFT_22586 [Metschnikowia bicuspidata]|uniref:Ribosomal protein L27 n=1 Tax=Metschnikowia bicuspidata TaxID=27322 RepID=A0A4P9ZFP1_9ASCO|nr:hypothetical protein METBISCDRAFT_22586 [Metschnikowia bicuspidata]